MSDKVTQIICTCELDNGYIFKNFFAFNSIRGHPTITFLNDSIRSENSTADKQLFGTSLLCGDEISLKWNNSIPAEQQKLSLTFDSGRLPSTMGKIKKKEMVKLFIAQISSKIKPDFVGMNSSDDFTIYISCGTGGEGREGIQSLAATRVTPSTLFIRPPIMNISNCLTIPIRLFRKMIESFSKTKKQKVKICMYPNKDSSQRSGILITTNMYGGYSTGSFEKYGEVPDDPSSTISNIELPISSVDESQIIRPSSSGVRLVIEVEDDVNPNEYIFNSDNITVFTKLASMYNEGNVRIYYQKGRHLCITHRFGGFGECSLFLHNKFIEIL